MDMFMQQRKKIRSINSQFQSLFSFFIYRNRAVLALQAASVFFLFILLSLRVNFSAISISFFSFHLGRTHMFILCNGIVAILVKGSVLATTDEEGDADADQKKKNGEISEEKPGRTEKVGAGVEEGEEEDQKTANGRVFVAETEQIDQQLAEEEEQELQDREEEEEEEERKEEDEFDELSVEELNKKCDEFIRRMRGVISNGNRFL